MLSKGSKLMSPAAVLILLCFFLPWITVSCAGQPVQSVTGWQLASDGRSPELFLVPLAALTVLGIVFLLYQQRIKLRTGAFAAMGASAVGLLILLVKFLSSRSQLGNLTDLSSLGSLVDPSMLGDISGLAGDAIKLSPQIGLWGVILAFLAVIIGAVLDVMDRESSHSGYEGGYVYTSGPPPTLAPPPVSPVAPTSARPTPIERTRQIDQAPRAMAWLVVQGGPYAGKQFGLVDGRNIIGRDGTRSDFILDDDLISGQHAQVRFENGQFVMYDLASTNHTFVNNRQVQRQPLMDNDVVRLGNTQIVFKAVPKPRQ